MANTRTIVFTNSEGAKLRVELELRTKQITDKETKEIIEVQEVFSASGTYWENKDRPYTSAGQCLDVIPEFIKSAEDKEDKEKLLLIHRLWKNYHLNDMHTDCEHAINEVDAKKELTIYEYHFKSNFFKLKDKIDLIKSNKYLRDNIKLNKTIRMILDTGYSFKSETKHCNLPKVLRKFYKLDKTEVKTAGWVYYDKNTPHGILKKPCPVCGYEYGTAWKYRPIPTKDLKRIKELIG